MNTRVNVALKTNCYKTPDDAMGVSVTFVALPMSRDHFTKAKTSSAQFIVKQNPLLN